MKEKKPKASFITNVIINQNGLNKVWWLNYKKKNRQRSVMLYLFLVLSPWGVQWLDESGGVADEHGVAGSTDDHTEHGEPHVGHPFWSLGTVPDTQHVAHGFEQSIRVLQAPRVILWDGRRVRRTVNYAGAAILFYCYFSVKGAFIFSDELRHTTSEYTADIKTCRDRAI